MTEQEQKLSAELQQIRQEKSFAAKLKQEQIYNLVERHKKTILQDFEYDLTNPAEYYAHRDLVRQLGNDYTGREFRSSRLTRTTRRYCLSCCITSTDADWPRKCFPMRITRFTRTC